MSIERIAATSVAIAEAQAAPAPAREKPLLEVAGGPGGVSRESLRELWVFREVLAAFLVRQVKVKYKQAAVGIGWAVIQPVVAAALFALFLGKLADVGSEGAPYLLFALAGMCAWTYFSGSASAAMESLVADQALLRKVYFPREVLPLAAVGAGLVDFLPGLATLVVAAFLFGIPPALSWVVLPLPILVLMVTAAAFGLGLSGLNVYYRDVRHALPFVVQMGLFASPVIYSLSVVPGSWRGVYAILNPVAAAIDSLRRIVVHHTWPDFAVLFAALGWSLLLALGAYVLFKRLERGFSDRV
jgi:lipopolysaccharide transport system permease protein